MISSQLLVQFVRALQQYCRGQGLNHTGLAQCGMLVCYMYMYM